MRKRSTRMAMKSQTTMMIMSRLQLRVLSKRVLVQPG